MAQKTLNAYVVIGGHVDNSFGQIGSELIALGSTVDEISSKLINFGKKSLDVYQDYDTNMREAEGALATTYGKETLELESIMADLDMYANMWAENSIFHTDDVSHAINEAAHANWNYEQIIAGMPAAMRLAQAGNMSLSQGLDYIITSTKAAKIGFEDLNDWIDIWTFAANSSAGTIEEFGDAIQKMGSTVQFADSREELLTLIAVLHDTGTKGSAAGTLLRNSMIRLIAPTKTANKAMEALGVTEDEVSEAMGEVVGDIDAANESLERVGFSAYDENGNLKGFIETFSDLNKAVSGMTEQERNNVLSSIFPTRTITGALAFLDAASKGFDGLYASMKAGDAAGYSEYLSELVTGGLMGSTKLLESKFEALELVLGKQISPQLITIEGNVGRIIDKLIQAGQEDNGVSSGLDFLERASGFAAGIAESIGEIDPVAFDGIVAGLGTIATLGPGMIIAGSAMRLIGWALGTWPGRIMLAAAGVAAMAEAINAMNKADFEGAFGKMSLNEKELKPITQAIHDDFMNAYNGIDQYRQALTKAGEAYEEASTKLSSESLTDALTGKPLTPDDLKAYIGYGNQMVQAVLDGLKISNDLSVDYWKMLFSNNGEIPEGVFDADPQYQSLIETIDSAYQSSVDHVIEIGKNLRHAIISAFDDGTITPDEQENILKYFRDLNEAMVEAQAEAESEEAAIQREMLLHKAQTLSFSSLQDFIETDINAQKEDDLAKSEGEYARQRAKLAVDYKKRIAAAETEEEKSTIEAEMNAVLQRADEEHVEERASIQAPYDEIIMAAFESALKQSEYGDASAFWQGLVNDVANGVISPETARDIMNQSEYSDTDGFVRSVLGALGITDDGSDKNGIQKYYAAMEKALGGYEDITARIQYYEDIAQKALEGGKPETAAQYSKMAERLQNLEMLIAYGKDYQANEARARYFSENGQDRIAEHYQYWNSLNVESEITGDPLAAAKETLHALETRGETGIRDLMEAVRGVLYGTVEKYELREIIASTPETSSRELERIISNLGSSYDFGEIVNSFGINANDALRDYYALYDLLYGDAADWKEAGKTRQIIAEKQEQIKKWQEQLNELAALDEYRLNPGMFDYLTGDYKLKMYRRDELLKQKPEIEASIEQTLSEIEQLNAQLEAVGQPKTGTEQKTIERSVTFPDAEENAKVAREAIEAEFTPIEQAVYIGIYENPNGAEGGGGMTYTTLGADGKPEMLKPRAEGGRGTEPSIFAEAGVPEWFIPERHDDNTLRLILGAAEMSGFSLIDLAAYAGADMYAEGGSTEDRRIPFARGSGGRGEKPSIFAEAGVPEWFIPERHDDNTLRLILGAAEMSGFSMIDLAAYAGADMYAEGGTTGGAVNWGSLSDSSGSSGGSAGGDTIKVQYSPVIHADNADGVNQVLRDDKKRMKKMLRELLEEKELYESVVAYR